MKIKNLFGLLACGLVLAFVSNASADDIKNGIATIVRVQGVARYSLDGQTWHPLVVGKTFHAGAKIQTGENSMVDVVLGKSDIAFPQAAPSPEKISPAQDEPVRGFVSFKPSVEQNVVRLSANTTLGIDKLTISETGVDTVSDTELDLKQGKIYNSVKKLSPSSQYIVKLPSGVAGVRGTKFTISADGSISALEHDVMVSIVGPDGKPTTVLVKEGNSFNPSTGAVTPLSPSEIAALTALATAGGTLYYEATSFTGNDLTKIYVSPTAGSQPGNTPLPE